MKKMNLEETRKVNGGFDLGVAVTFFGKMAQKSLMWRFAALCWRLTQPEPGKIY